MQRNYCYCRSAIWIPVFLVILFNNILSFGQTGPAGVGNAGGTNGEPKNMVWLDANRITAPVGTDISLWSDISGNNNHFVPSLGNYSTTPNDGSNAGSPSLKNTGFNHLEFKAADHDRLVVPSFGVPTDAITTFVILKTASQGQGILSYAVAGSDNEYLLHNAGNISVYIKGSAKNPGTDFRSSNWQILSNRWRSSDGALSLGKNGNIYTSDVQTGTYLTANGNLALGGEQDAVDDGYAVDQDFEGNVSEVIMYNAYLTDAQRTIVENYLSQKYNIGVAKDYFGNSPNYATTYNRDIRGIGSDGTGKRTDAQSSGALTVRENANSLDADEYVMLAHNGTSHAITTTNRADAINITDRWARDWYVEKNRKGIVNGGDVSVQMMFDFTAAGLTYSGMLSNYVLLYRSAATGNFNRVYANSYTIEGSDKIVVSVPASQLSTGYYTLGTGTPLLAKTWYVFRDGNWNDPNTWTTDASTAPLFKNAGNQIPGINDEVIIRSGRTVTVQPGTNGLEVSTIKVNGNLNLTTSAGHDFHAINGNGEIRMAGNGSSLTDNFPQGNTMGNIGFADADNGGTVIVQAAANITLNAAHTFRHMRVDLVNSTSRAIVSADLLLNGNLEVRNGNLQFGDGTVAKRKLTVNGDVLIADNGAQKGSISTAAANARHKFNIKGDFTNNGIAKFTNRSDFASIAARNDTSNTYYLSEANNGIVDVLFTNGHANQTVKCNNTTLFYRIVVDKGVDDTYKLLLQATSENNFRLLGFANYDVNADQRTEAQNINAFALINGTAEIGSNVEIPVLNSGVNYAVSSTTRLWVNGGNVRKTAGTAIVPYGKVQVSAGYLEANVSSGLTIRNNGLIIVEGGAVFTRQIRTSVEGVGSLGGYKQSGGTVTVDGTAGTNASYYVFSLTYPGNVFLMSGGTLTVKGANSQGAIFINSDPGNIGVTGGTVTVESSNTNIAKVTSKAPFYNFSVTNTVNSTSAKVAITPGSSGDGTAQRSITATPDLVVLNDLTIQTGTTRNDGTNTYGGYLDFCTSGTCANLKVGRNLTLNDNTVLDMWNGNTNNTGSSSVTFNGTQNATLYIGDITNYKTSLTDFKNPEIGVEAYERWEHPFYNLMIDKPGATLFLAAKNPIDENLNSFKATNGGKNVNKWRNNIFLVTNELSITEGTTLNQIDQTKPAIGYSIRVYGSNVTNKGKCFVYTDGTTPKNAMVKFRVGGGDITLNTIASSEFGNIRINSGVDKVFTTSNVYMKRLEYNHGRLDIGKHNLKVDVLDINLSGGSETRTTNGNNIFSVEDMIITAGNVSDGGLSLKVQKNTDTNFPEFKDNEVKEYNDNRWLWFPIGTSANSSVRYTPAVCYIKTAGTYNGDEYITVRGVDGELQTTNLTGGDLLSYYWNVDFKGFSPGEEPVVSWLFQYDQSDVAGTETNYVPGKVLNSGTYTRSNDGGITAVKDGGATNDNKDIVGNNPGNIIIFNNITTGANDNIDGVNANVFTNAPNVAGAWNNAFPGMGFTLERANYTAGAAARFVGAPLTYYSRVTNGYENAVGNASKWNNKTTWSTVSHTGPAASDYPKAGDIAIIKAFATSGERKVIIGIEDYSGNVSVDVKVAKLILKKQNVNEASTANNRLMIAQNANVDFGIVEGDATMQVFLTNTSTPVFNTTDFGNFVSQVDSGSMFLFYGYSDGTLTLPSEITEYPNVRFEGNNDVAIDRFFQFPKDATVRDLIVDSRATFRVLHNLTIKNNLRIGAYRQGFMQFDGTNGVVQVAVEGDLMLRSDSDNRVFINNSNNNLKHKLMVKGDIVFENNTVTEFDLHTNLTGGDNVILELGTTASTAKVWDNQDDIVPELYNIIMNGGSDTTTTFSANTNFTLPVATAGFQPIEILNGTLILNNSGINATLANGSDFYLPNTANPKASSGSGGLEIRQGTARITGNNTGIILDGLLRVSGGTLNMDGGANVNNFIEYSSSGQAKLDITDGTLLVGSQIRRGINANTGVLQYTQSGGTVVVGKNAAPEVSRGIFEVTNSGSYFEHTGGSLTLVRDNNSTTAASLLLEPANAYIADSTTITIGNGNTPAGQQRFGTQSSIGLAKLKIASANIQAKLYNLPLTARILDIGTGAKFDANGFDLTIYENLNIDGMFAASGNTINNQTTAFPVATASTATITGGGMVNFWNLEKSGSGILRLSSNITVNNNAFIYSGVLNTQTSAFNIKKDLLHDGVHISDPAGPGIVFNGTQKQILDRSGSGLSQIGVMNINNASGLLIRDTEENFRINGKLILTTGVFDVGGNLVEFPANAFIENGSGGRTVGDFNVNNMIQTNSAIRDFGIRKYFNAVNNGNATFTYPVGLVAYTPVVVSANKVSASSITIRPVRDVAPIQEDTEYTFDGTSGCSDPNIIDANNVLQYYWIVKTDGVNGFDGTLLMYYDPNDIALGNTGTYTIANYGPARLFNNSTSWDKTFTTNDFNEASRVIKYPLNDVNSTLAGIYTAGVTLENNGTGLLCGAAIPDQVPQFVTANGGGTFFTGTSYAGGIAPVAGETPDITIKAGHTLKYNQSNIRTRKITIEPGGTLEIQNGTNNHNLGFVTGTGTLRLVSNGTSVVFPTGDYEEFFPDANCSGGGTLEYTGTGSYAVLNDLPNIRRVIFAGSGARALPNNFALNVCEDFDIRGTVAVTIVDGNNTTVVRGNVYKSDNSSFTHGGGNSKVVMAGVSPQFIRGNFTGNNALNRLEVNNAAGLSVINAVDATRGISANRVVEVDKELIFTNGRITTNGNNVLRMLQGAKATNYASSRYVNGPLQAKLSDNDNFHFPVGKGNRYGLMWLHDATYAANGKLLTWQAEYFDASPETEATVTNVNQSSDPGIMTISRNEYWKISDNKGDAPGGTVSADIGLSWDASSDVSQNAAERKDLRVMVWNSTSSKWDNAGGVSHTGSPITGTLISGAAGTSVSFSEKVVTLGSTSMNNPLPVELVSFNAEVVEQQTVLTWQTASEYNNDFFEVQHSTDGESWLKVGAVAGSGTSTEVLSYRFLHTNPQMGSNFYRLKQVDYDGKYDYSTIVHVVLNFDEALQQALKLIVFPNPAHDNYITLQVVALANSQTKAVVQLTDLSGRILIYEEVEAAALAKGLLLPYIQPLSAGLYIVRVQHQQDNIQTKLIIK